MLGTGCAALGEAVVALFCFGVNVILTIWVIRRRVLTPKRNDLTFAYAPEIVSESGILAILFADVIEEVPLPLARSTGGTDRPVTETPDIDARL